MGMRQLGAPVKHETSLPSALLGTPSIEKLESAEDPSIEKDKDAWDSSWLKAQVGPGTARPVGGEEEQPLGRVKKAGGSSPLAPRLRAPPTPTRAQEAPRRGREICAPRALRRAGGAPGAKNHPHRAGPRVGALPLAGPWDGARLHLSLVLPPPHSPPFLGSAPPRPVLGSVPLLLPLLLSPPLRHIASGAHTHAACRAVLADLR